MFISRPRPHFYSPIYGVITCHAHTSKHLLHSVPSALWHCWLDVRKSIRPVKIEWLGWGGYLSGARCRLSHALSSSFSSQMRKMHDTTTLLLVTLPNIHRLKKFTRTLSNKPFLIWLLTTPLHLKYVTTLPCNLSLMACFAGIVLQGSQVVFTVISELIRFLLLVFFCFYTF